MHGGTFFGAQIYIIMKCPKLLTFPAKIEIIAVYTYITKRENDMIYYTGDIHGEINKILYDILQLNLTSADTIAILGDAGLNYHGNAHGDKRKKKHLNEKGVTIFCIHGNHEMRPATIPSYKTKEWNGGIVYYEDEYPYLLFAKDGEIYSLDGKKTIVIGGAYSVDKFYRLMRGYNWFDDEQPSVEIKHNVEMALEKNNWVIDQVLSHTCPSKYIPVKAFLSGIDQSTVDSSTENWLDGIENKLNYKRWLCGHWHIDKKIDKVNFLMDDIIE